MPRTMSRQSVFGSEQKLLNNQAVASIVCDVPLPRHQKRLVVLEAGDANSVRTCVDMGLNPKAIVAVTNNMGDATRCRRSLRRAFLPKKILEEASLSSLLEPDGGLADCPINMYLDYTSTFNRDREQELDRAFEDYLYKGVLLAFTFYTGPRNTGRTVPRTPEAIHRRMTQIARRHGRRLKWLTAHCVSYRNNRSVMYHGQCMVH